MGHDIGGKTPINTEKYPLVTVLTHLLGILALGRNCPGSLTGIPLRDNRGAVSGTDSD